jgi:hypothetical protein
MWIGSGDAMLLMCSTVKSENTLQRRCLADAGADRRDGNPAHYHDESGYFGRPIWRGFIAYASGIAIDALSGGPYGPPP